jgi:16S rRNA (cytidine1402-2'-O)-methyltransferase
MKTLYLVATPIGNLQDMSTRAVETLKNVGKIYAEDTRRTGKLLRHFGIETPVQSYFEHNELQRIPNIVRELESQDLALVSDAGTPTISDPGFKLVREVSGAGFEVISIPGPNAALLALTSSGLPTDRFTFLGFLPHKESAKRKILEEVREWRTTLVFYESPYRVKETLDVALEILGDRPVSVSRELTKMHEETVRGRLPEVLGRLPDKLKGEVTIVIGCLKE